MATAFANRMEALLPDSVANSLRNRTALMSNLPYWGAAMAAAFLVIAIVIRPCAQLLHITLLYVWECDSMWSLLGRGGNAANITAAAMTSEEEALGCSVGLAMVTRALRHMDTLRCLIQTMEGKPCITAPSQSKQHGNTTVCPSAALEFHGPTRRIIDWFVPFQRNGTIACAHTQWFNISSSVNGIVTTTMFVRQLI